MRALLDANVLIAFLDTEHNFHERAFDWFKANEHLGWATCPITENAVLRILTNPSYSKIKRFQLSDLSTMLRNNMRSTDHEFWPDDISLLDDNVVLAKNILGHKQLTDVYLLALAVKHNGRLVTFDARIAINSVKGATKGNLHVF